MSESEGPTRENSVTVFHSFTHSALAQRINSALGSFRERKNKQAAENAVLSGVGGLRVGSKGHLDVDRSIWDLTKGVHVEEQQVSSYQRVWEALREDVKTVATTVQRDPLVAIIPVLLLLVLLGGGLWAVFASAAKETEHRREVAQQIVGDKGLYLHTELAKAFLPAYVCSVYVRRDPFWPVVNNNTFAPMALELIRLSNAGSVLTLSLIPNGIIYTMVPLAGKGPDDDKNWRAIGKDWLQDTFNQDKVLQALSTRTLTIIGPYNLTQGGIGLVAMLSINVTNASINDTFGVPPMNYSTLPWQKSDRMQSGPNVTNTPFGPYMYDNVTSTKWWGLTTVLISWDILRERVLRLDELEGQGYDYVLSRPVQDKELSKANRSDLIDGRPHELAVAWSDAVQPVGPNVTNNNVPPKVPGGARPLVYYDLHQRLADPVSEVVQVEGAQMTLYVSLSSGWTPAWKTPLIVVVVVLSVVFSLMLFLMLVKRRQHMRLLHAMIPKKVVSTLRRGKIFTESFEVVTVLFSDIVAYTTMSAQMAPIEVVQMLDELYKEFDNLAEKHRLYKLDTIGDAIMLVGGAPDSEGATAAAARVAQMGLDMIRLTSTKVLAGGHVVKIRVGIHSGPAVAAVVGRKAPKYTLFGDTVNTASRMESNGSPMRIHISGATADLLAQAGGFMVEPRGEIPIKGKGVMSTFWVVGTQVCLEGPCPRSEAIDISHLTAPPPAATKIPENAEGERSAVSPKPQPPPSAPQPHLPRVPSAALAASSLSGSWMPHPASASVGPRDSLPSPPVARLAQSSTTVSRQASAAVPLARSPSDDSPPEAPSPLNAFASAAFGSTGSRDGPISTRSNMRYGGSHVVVGLDSQTHMQQQLQLSPSATSLLQSAPAVSAVAAAAVAVASPFSVAAAVAASPSAEATGSNSPPAPSAAASEGVTRSKPQLRE